MLITVESYLSGFRRRGSAGRGLSRQGGLRDDETTDGTRLTHAYVTHA